ncbi:MAG: helix-turn-helix transcriptional regulator [Ruminococcaceae bacterium]|nr:helix-turn-helix transcriptional regulator [Oscillospiraceae bacterium]
MIGKRIQEILDKKGMTQAELAELTGMSLAHINRIINGKSEPDKTVAKIAEALDVPVHALYSEDAQISALAIKNLEKLPADIVKAIGDRKKLDYIVLGLELSETPDVTPEEIKIIVEQMRVFKQKVKEMRKK